MPWLDDLVITINPKHALFYECLLLFKKVGEIKSCNEVNGHPAYAYLLELDTLSERYERVYKDQPVQKNLYHFFYEKEHSNIYLPENNTTLYIWNREKLIHFFAEKSNVFEQIDKQHLSYILNQHSHYISRSQAHSGGRDAVYLTKPLSSINKLGATIYPLPKLGNKDWSVFLGSELATQKQKYN